MGGRYDRVASCIYLTLDRWTTPAAAGLVALRFGAGSWPADQMGRLRPGRSREPDQVGRIGASKGGMMTALKSGSVGSSHGYSGRLML